MVIDFRKLNKATKKDHYPLPFIDQMLEILCKHTPIIGYLFTHCKHVININLSFQQVLLLCKIYIIIVLKPIVIL